MRHITLNCPNCDTPERSVGDPDHGVWHCFVCGAGGDLTISQEVDLATKTSGRQHSAVTDGHSPASPSHTISDQGPKYSPTLHNPKEGFE